MFCIADLYELFQTKYYVLDYSLLDNLMHYKKRCVICVCVCVCVCVWFVNKWFVSNVFKWAQTLCTQILLIIAIYF